MKVKVDNEKCLTCGMCTSIESEVFNFNDEGLVEADNSKITVENEDDVKSAIENCPVGAIEEINED